jgi:nifR3 family TIM-barrel protein
MVEITTPALRRQITGYDDRVVLHSEMLSAAAIVGGGPHNASLAARWPFDRHFVYQIEGGDPERMAEACRILGGNGPWGININMGCPVHHIMKKGHGAWLLRDEARAARIVRACRRATDLALSVKTRSGFDRDDEEAMVRFGRLLRDEGADYIVMHPRYAKLCYARHARWNLVKLLKETAGGPVVGNGDIVSAGDALSRMEESGCDGVMIGREAVKSPWIFRQLNDLADQGGYDLTIDIREAFVRGLRYIEEYLPPHLHRSRGLRFCFYFSRNMFHAHSFYTDVRKKTAIDEMIRVVENYYLRLPHEAVKRYRAPVDECACQAAGFTETIRAAPVEAG